MKSVDQLLDALQARPAAELEWRLRPGELRRAVDAWQERAQRMLRGGTGRRGRRG